MFGYLLLEIDTMKIDADANAADLIRNWINGNKNEVIEALSNDHAGLTAMVLVVGTGPDGELSRGDCNEIANRLIDDRQSRCR